MSNCLGVVFVIRVDSFVSSMQFQSMKKVKTSIANLLPCPLSFSSEVKQLFRSSHSTAHYHMKYGKKSCTIHSTKQHEMYDCCAFLIVT